MLRAAVAAGSEVGLKAKEAMESGQLVSDEIIIGIIKDRLAETDCQTKGWLLDGFPRTRAQADALAEAGITADIFLLLDVPDSALVERVVGRRTDPVTGKIYHMTFSPPENDEIAARLTQRADDTEEKVVTRLQNYHSNLNAILECYTDVMVRIDGNRNKSDIYKKIQTVLTKRTVKPLKIVIAGAPASGKGTQCERIKEDFGDTSCITPASSHPSSPQTWPRPVSLTRTPTRKVLCTSPRATCSAPPSRLAVRLASRRRRPWRAASSYPTRSSSVS
mmetsp:Transcript_20509/g.62516  ORF Transcript_20509/g.62516 Transcript_20509/m.62516 type:complete len:277 (-) Transcript_20509:170-1000(-)